MTTSSDPIRFEYEHHHLDAGTGVVTCSYVLGSRRFVEEVRAGVAETEAVGVAPGVAGNAP